MLAELCRGGELVLAAGGGAPLRAESRRALRAAGRVVWLQARPETILARMAADPTTAARRPALTECDALEEIVQLLDRREPMYREIAHLAIDTEAKLPEQVASEILDRLGLSANGNSVPCI